MIFKFVARLFEMRIARVSEGSTGVLELGYGELEMTTQCLQIALVVLRDGIDEVGNVKEERMIDSRLVEGIQIVGDRPKLLERCEVEGDGGREKLWRGYAGAVKRVSVVVACLSNQASVGLGVPPAPL